MGEAMLELSADGPTWRMGYGGDTLNTAVHLSRLGISTAYFTALGHDAFAPDLKTAWLHEGLCLDLVQIDPERTTGLYAIKTDPLGERTFTYWRSASAARRMLELPTSEAALHRAAQARVLYLSLITLGILPSESHERLWSLCRSIRSQGGRVIFDGNYRPTLWRTRADALVARRQALALCDLALPTLDDEMATSASGDIQSLLTEMQDLGVGQIALKMGEKGCIDGHGVSYPPARAIQPIDTSGAGDAFNAGFIAAWIRHLPFAVCAQAGNELAGWVIKRAGAIPQPDPEAPYRAIQLLLQAR
ncbi:MAG TPA: sugar kinase [Steroidobacteraceae bacterium]|nr:sugar kinase [Steroidobacteraceae bacterium]